MNKQNDNIIKKNKSRNKTLDIYKGLLIILVVVRHVLQYSVSDEGGVLTNFIWAVQMPGFMLVAGYFSARNISSINQAGKRIILSFQHYAVPFFSWFLLIEVLLLGHEGRNPILGFVRLLSQVDRGLWFLWVVFILSIVVTLGNFALSSKKWRFIKTGVVFIVCFGIFLIIGKLAGINFFGIKFILYYSIFYGCGWFVKWTELWLKQRCLAIKNIVMFLCLATFLAIIFNFDLYHTGDGILSIALRCVAGFTGNAVLLGVCESYAETLGKLKLDKLGMYTLEIYVTHMCVNNLMEMGQSFFTAYGFENFICSLILTTVFTTIIIATFKVIPLANFIFFGKK